MTSFGFNGLSHIDPDCAIKEFKLALISTRVNNRVLSPLFCRTDDDNFFFLVISFKALLTEL